MSPILSKYWTLIGADKARVLQVLKQSKQWCEVCSEAFVYLKYGLTYYSIGCILTKTHMKHHTDIICSLITFLVFLLFTNFGIDHLILFVCLCCQDGKRPHQLTDGRLRRRLMKAIVRRLCSEIWWYV